MTSPGWPGQSDRLAWMEIPLERLWVNRVHREPSSRDSANANGRFERLGLGPLLRKRGSRPRLTIRDSWWTCCARRNFGRRESGRRRVWGFWSGSSGSSRGRAGGRSLPGARRKRSSLRLSLRSADATSLICSARSLALPFCSVRRCREWLRRLLVIRLRR